MDGPARSLAVLLDGVPLAKERVVVPTTYFGAWWWPAAANARVEIGLDEMLRDLSDEFDAHRLEILDEVSRGVSGNPSWITESPSLSLRELAISRPREVMDFIDLYLMRDYVASALSQEFLGSTWCVVRLDPPAIEDGVGVVPALIVPPDQVKEIASAPSRRRGVNGS